MAFSVGLAAQSATGAQSGSNAAKKNSDGSTITGCLQPANPKDAKDPSKVDDFVLATAATNASTGAGSSDATSSERGPFKLSGGDKDQLRKYLNSRVEITGNIEKSPTAGVATTGQSSTAGTSGSAMSTGSKAPDTKTAGRTLRVDSIRQVAGSCGM